MKNIRQIICLLLAMTTLFAAVSCAKSKNPSETPADTTEAKETTAPEDTTTEPDNTPAEPPKLSEELKLEIQKAYAESHNKNNPDKPITQEDVFVFGYRGEYSGAHVVTINVSGYSYPAIIESIIVNGEEISYSYPPPDVYKDGEFYEVESAFEKGILSAEDIKALAEFTKRR